MTEISAADRPLGEHQREFIEFALARGCLRFGQFQLKSGRVSPFFFNAGLIHSGRALHRMGELYARALEHHFTGEQLQCALLFGPAYKGIPLVAATSIALQGRHPDWDSEIPFAFNRKELKDHGEGGQVVGCSLQGPMIILDDVITAGTAIGETMALVAQFPQARAIGALVALDRQERGPTGRRSAVQHVADQYQMPVYSIITLSDLLQYLREQVAAGKNDEYGLHLQRIEAYRNEYGVLDI